MAFLSLLQNVQEPAPGIPMDTPASVTADHVRAALADPSNTSAWEALEASAESLPAAESASGWEGTVESVLFRIDGVLQNAGTEVLLGTLGIVLTLFSARLVWRSLRSQRRAARRREPTVTIASDVSAGRAWTAAVLAEQGMTGVEIARRTGMSRDTVQLALRTSRTDDGDRSAA